MKILLVSVIIITVNLTAFSQSDTGSRKLVDTSYIKLEKAIAKEVVKELLQKDYLEKENSLLQSNSTILSKTIQLKDSIIKGKNEVIDAHRQRDSAYRKIVSLKDQQIKEYKTLSEDLTSSLKKAKNKVALTSTLGLLSITIGMVLFLSR